MQKVITCIELQAEQILSANIWYTHFSNFDVAFGVPFLCYFRKLQLLVGKKFRTNFYCIVLLYIWAQKGRFRFLNSYFRLETLIFLSLVVSFFNRYVQLKSSFSDNKNINGKIWDTSTKIPWLQKLDLCKVIHSAKLHWKH